MTCDRGHARSGRIYTSAVWDQTGAAVRISFNNGYAIGLGTVSGTSISGTAGNVAGRMWAWSGYRLS